MATQSNQVQLKISLSERLNDLLQSKAARLGVPVTQFVKYILIKEVDEEEYPTFEASEWVEKKAKKAMRDIDKAVTVDEKDLKKFLEEL